jgi:hypothetical protein
MVEASCAVLWATCMAGITSARVPMARTLAEGGAAGFVAVAEEAVEAAVDRFVLVLIVGGGGSHSVSPAFVMTFDTNSICPGRWSLTSPSAKPLSS